MSVRSRAASESSSGEERHLQAVDLVPELREHGDEQRVRDEHGREHAERRADSELCDEVEAEEREAGDRDRDGQAGEDRRSARGSARLGRRVARRQPFVEVLPEARDDEERVVDADAEPDHRHEQRRDRVDVGEAGEDEEQEERRHERDDRERDRDRRRDERAEHDQQHDERGEQAEELLRALLDRRELGVAVELDDHAGRLDRLANGVLHGDDLRAVLLVDDAVELRLRVRDPAVLGERLVREGVADAGRCRPAVRSVPVGANSVVWSFATASSIAARRSGVSRRSPSGAAKTRFSTPPCSDANSASIRSVARCVSEPGISNSSFRLPPTVRDEQDERGDDPDPGER